MQPKMTDEEINRSAMDWCSRALNWSDEDMLFIGSRDGGELIAYLSDLIERMKVAEEEMVNEMTFHEEE